MPHFRVSSSPKSFWEVAVNYGPDFPYKPHSSNRTSPTESVFSQAQLSRRRSSSASVPALISDADTSEYSEDIDPFAMDLEDESVDDFSATDIVKIEKSPQIMSSESRIIPKRETPLKGEQKEVGDFDVASVLLDLRHHVRLTSANPEPAIPRDDNEPTVVSVETTGNERKSLQSAEKDRVEIIVPPGYDCALNDGKEEIQLQVTNEDQKPEDQGSSYSEHEVCTVISFVFNLLAHSIRIKIDIAKPTSISLDQSETCTNSTEESEAMATLGDEIVSSAPQLSDIGDVIDINEAAPICTEVNVELAAPAILSPLSSPLTCPFSPSAEVEPLSPLSSPATCTTTLPEVPFTSDFPDHKDSALEEKIMSTPTSPIAGPSKLRLPSVERGLSSETIEIPPASLHGVAQTDGRTQTPAAVTVKRKRSRRPSLDTISSTPNRSSSPSTSTNVARPRKKRTKRPTEEPTECHADGKDLTNVENASRACKATNPAARASPAPRAQDQMMIADTQNDDDERVLASARSNMLGFLVQAMALSRASSMPTSTLLKVVLRENAHLVDQRSKDSWLKIVQSVLRSHDVFGRIDREGLVSNYPAPAILA